MQRLSQTRESLGKTLSRILDINRKRKELNHHFKEQKEIEELLEEELKVLNQVASNQAHLVKKYETKLALEKAM